MKKVTQHQDMTGAAVGQDDPTPVAKAAAPAPAPSPKAKAKAKDD